MSAFERLPRAYRDRCAAIAKERPERELGGYKGSKIRFVPISPQNRKVRALADEAVAAEKRFPNPLSRQQRRFARRRGIIVAAR